MQEGACACNEKTRQKIMNWRHFNDKSIEVSAFPKLLVTIPRKFQEKWFKKGVYDGNDKVLLYLIIAF